MVDDNIVWNVVDYISKNLQPQKSNVLMMETAGYHRDISNNLRNSSVRNQNSEDKKIFTTFFR